MSNYLVQTGRMVRVAVNLGNEVRHDLELRVVRANVDVEILHVVWRSLPPILRMVEDIVLRTDNRRLAILRPSRAVKVQAVHPNTSPIEHLACVVLVERLRGVRKVQIEVSGRAVTRRIS